MSVIDDAYSIARACRERAHAPYSGFLVGAAVVTRTGNAIYGGCNVENASYGATICAERGAVLGMVSAEGRQLIDHVIVVTDADPLALPCGMCLQVLAEFADPETRVHIADLDGVRHEYRFDELLPYSFRLT